MPPPTSTILSSCLLPNHSTPSFNGAVVAGERFPETPVVVDHFARIGISGTIEEAELAQLCRLARHPKVTVKLSAFYALGEHS